MIDPQHFGETRAEVRQLQVEVRELRDEIREFREILSQARGGWKVGAFALSAAAVIGGAASWFLRTFMGGPT
jgi:hypothetical protein